MRRALIAVVVTLVVLALAPAVPAASTGGEATIIRDEYGVPHIFADDESTLFAAFGYTQAQDRLWQAEILRRTATGTLAELFGADSVASDAQTRLLFGPAEHRAQLFDAAPQRTKDALTAHAAGMNAWIEEATGGGLLPLEYSAFGIAPRPWTVDDTVATFMLVGSQFGWFGSDDLTTAAVYEGLVAALGPEAAAEVFTDTHWLDDPDAPTTVPGPSATSAASADLPAELPDSVVDAAATVAADRAAAERARARVGLRSDGHASNAAVIGPELSRDGRPLLLGGPQMGYTAPQINHEVGLHGAGFDVTGMTIAGFPLVPIGVGDGLAWTLTSGGTDNTDIFVEVLNPADPAQYLFDGEWRDMDCTVESIGVAGADPIAQTLCRTVHGPVLAVAGDNAFSLRNTTFGNELTSLDAWMRLGQANDLDDFTTGLPGVAYNFNVLYADDDGNIAYWHVGQIPVRSEGVDPRFPTPGTGEAEWQGVIPFEDMPHALNPGQGYLASWNNKPAPGWANSSTDFWRWGRAHRVNTFLDFLATVPPHSAAVRTLERLNRTGGWTTDTPTGQASLVLVSSILDELLAHVDHTADPRLRQIVPMLASWNHLQVDNDGDGAYDHPGGAIFNAWWEAFAARVFSDDTAGLIDRFTIGNLADRLLRGADAALPLAHDYLQGESLSGAVTASLVAALDELTVTYGSAEPAAWQQPIATITWSPLGIGTVADTIWMNRGTYNQIVHLGEGRDLFAQNVVSPGQSGDFRSPHFADQLELYATWQYKPMRLSAADLRGHEESVTVFTSP
jgi:penicillin amidase